MNTQLTLRSLLTLISYSLIAGMKLTAGRRPALLIWLVAIVIAGFTGCSKENPTGPQTATIGHPGVGSTFIYKVTTQINHGPLEISYDTLTVSRIGLQVAGESDVIEMHHPLNESSEYNYLYLHYESNGDISWSNSDGASLTGNDSTLWIIAPVRSHTTPRQLFTDDSPYADFPFISIASVYEGTETIAVDNAAIASEKSAMTTTYSRQGGDSLSDVRRFWFAPTVGNFTRTESDDNHGERRELVSYSLKP